MDVIKKLTHTVSDSLDYLNNNRIVSSVLGLFLILYASLAAPKLPSNVSAWFDNVWFKLGFMFLIAYMATRDPSVAIIAAVALLVTLQTLSAHRTTAVMVNAVQANVEKFRGNLREQFSSTQESEPEHSAQEVHQLQPTMQPTMVSESNLHDIQDNVVRGFSVDEHASVEGVSTETEPTTAPEAHIGTVMTEADQVPVSCGNSMESVSGYDDDGLAAL